MHDPVYLFHDDIMSGNFRLQDLTHSTYYYDSIAIVQAHVKAAKAKEFHVWTLKVNPDSTTLLTCVDGNNRIVYKQSIHFTDFPLPEIKLCFTDNVIMPTSES